MKRARFDPSVLVATGAVLFLTVLTLTIVVDASGAAQDRPPSAVTPPAAPPPTSVGCLTCHDPDVADMHPRGTGSRVVGCTDCHGGDATVMKPAGVAGNGPEARDIQRRAHVQPRLSIWNGSSANPAGQWYRTLDEDAAFIRFVNPGDLRVAREACGTCHLEEVRAVEKSMMRHGGTLWGAALYNNGSYPLKDNQFGEFYTADGRPARAYTTPVPTAAEIAREGWLPFLQPLFPWQVTQPGNILRVFERGGRRPLETGLPDVDDEAGRPRNRLSNRGLGTLNRTDPVFIGLQKTRLFDPTLNFMGSNDGPGDYRHGGCAACHVVYANDRSPVHSGRYASAGNHGATQTRDPMIPKNQSGHPIAHTFTREIPTSQCMVCHMHPGTNMVTPYLGLTWWDNETDGAQMYPARGLQLSDGERAAIERRNPEGSAVRGLWSDPAFLQQTGSAEFNAKLTQTQFADFHGHGWLFRAVFKRDRKGNLLDAQGAPITDASSGALAEAVAYQDLTSSDDRQYGTKARDARAAARPGRPVHLKDIHLERGMQCVDCHFRRDAHGDGKLYNEPRAAIEIACVDCHGTVSRWAFGGAERPVMATTGPGAAVGGGTPLMTTTTSFGSERFSIDYDDDNRPILIQRSMSDRNLSWRVPQVRDTVDPSHPSYNARAAFAKTIQRDNRTWGAAASSTLAHNDERMSCTTCHSSWVTSCFGCHLSQTANQKRDALHNRVESTRNWTSYNFQVLRDDVYMLGKDGTAAGGRISPVRSSSAVVVSSQDLNRQNIYLQQQTVSAEGYSGQAFNTHVPHTVRTTETKACTDCHVSAAGDNNAIMSQLLLLGTNFVNFMGRFVYVATGSSGIEAVAITEVDEPQAVIGSDLHRLAYPERYAAHEQRGRQLTAAIHHGSANALGIQARGEYLYIADGEAGFRAFDIAQVNQKGFSEKIVTAPISPLGQRTAVKTQFATAVAAPSTLAVDPTRSHQPQNEEQPIHPVYGYVYITDRMEGLVVSTAATLLDGNPSNNFLQRAATFNPDGRLTGASNIAIAGVYAYITTPRGLAIVSLNTPTRPRLVAEVSGLNSPSAIAVQFRYAFVTDADGLKVVDITTPEQPRLIDAATLRMRNARSIYVARTYAYIAAGADGVVIIDVEKPEQPYLDQTFNGGGAINDAYDVKVAMTNASVYAYVADGRNGLRVLQLISANGTAGAFGFSPRPTPRLIASYKTGGPAVAISKGLDRDRAVDESGNQIAVFGRRGGRPLNAEEMRRMYLRDGMLWTVSDTPGTPAQRPSALTAVPGPARPSMLPVPSHRVTRRDIR